MCAPCHGPDASGGGSIGPLKSFNGSREDFVQITLDGRLAKGMPPFQGRVSDDEVAAVRAFVLTLAK
jgi:mono/diheme cytochrome c family protein